MSTKYYLLLLTVDSLNHFALPVIFKVDVNNISLVAIEWKADSVGTTETLFCDNSKQHLYN